MNDINARILDVIEKSGMKKVDVGRLCGVSGQHISGLCSGASAPSNAFIMQFCRAMNVNETWLRTGEGDPKQDTSLLEDVGQRIAEIMTNKTTEEQQTITRALVRMGPNGWKALLEFLEEFQRSMDADRKKSAE